MSAANIANLMSDAAFLSESSSSDGSSDAVMMDDGFESAYDQLELDEIQIQLIYSEKVSQYRIPSSSPLDTFMDLIEEKLEVYLETVEFYFGTLKIDRFSTPEKLGMTQLDVIHARILTCDVDKYAGELTSLLQQHNRSAYDDLMWRVVDLVQVSPIVVFNATVIGESGVGALHVAAMSGKFEYVRLLIARGARSKCSSLLDITPLHVFAQVTKGQQPTVTDAKETGSSESSTRMSAE